MIKKIRTGDYDLELLSAYNQTLDVEEMILYIDLHYDDFLDWKRGQKGREPKHYELSKSSEVLEDIKSTYEEFLTSDPTINLLLFDIESDSERR